MKQDTRSVRFGIEVILVVVVLIILFKTFGLPGETVQPEPDTNTPDTTQSTELPPQVSEFQKTLEDSGLVEEYITTELPQIDGLTFYDPSKFVEAEVAQYNAGDEYYLTFDYPGFTEYELLGLYYGQYATENGWDLTFSILGGNGTHNVFNKDNMEVEAMAIIRQAEDGTHFVREKTRVYITN